MGELSKYFVARAPCCLLFSSVNTTLRTREDGMNINDIYSVILKFLTTESDSISTEL